MSDQTKDDQQEFEPLYGEQPIEPSIDLGEVVEPVSHGNAPQEQTYVEEAVDMSGGPNYGAEESHMSAENEFESELTDFSDIDDGIGDSDIDEDEGIFAPPREERKKKSSFGMMLVAVSAIAILGAGGYFYVSNPDMVSQIKDNLTGTTSEPSSNGLPSYELIGTPRPVEDIADAAPVMDDMPPQPSAIVANGDEESIQETAQISVPGMDLPDQEPSSVLTEQDVVIEDPNSMTVQMEEFDSVAPVIDEPPIDVPAVADSPIELPPQVSSVDVIAPPPVVDESVDVMVEPPVTGMSVEDVAQEPVVVAPVDTPPQEMTVTMADDEAEAPASDTPSMTEQVEAPVAVEPQDMPTPDRLTIVNDTPVSSDRSDTQRVEKDKKEKALEEQQQQIADAYFDAPPGDMMKKLPAPSLDVKRGAGESIIVVAPQKHKVTPPKLTKTVVPDSSVTIEATSLEPRIVAAGRALKLGRLESARSMYDALYNINPRDPRILMGRAVLFQKTGDSARAISTYEEVLSVDPNNADAIINLTGLVRKDYPAEALGKLLDLRQKYPENATVTAQLGVAYAESGNFEDAYRYLSMASHIEPNNAQHYYNMAIVAERGHDVAKAINLYEKSLEVDAIHGSGRAVNRDIIYDRLTRLRGH